MKHCVRKYGVIAGVVSFLGYFSFIAPSAFANRTLPTHTSGHPVINTSDSERLNTFWANFYDWVHREGHDSFKESAIKHLLNDHDGKNLLYQTQNSKTWKLREPWSTDTTQDPRKTIPSPDSRVEMAMIRISNLLHDEFCSQRPTDPYCATNDSLQKEQQYKEKTLEYIAKQTESLANHPAHSSTEREHAKKVKTHLVQVLHTRDQLDGGATTTTFCPPNSSAIPKPVEIIEDSLKKLQTHIASKAEKETQAAPKSPTSTTYLGQKSHYQELVEKMTIHAPNIVVQLEHEAQSKPLPDPPPPDPISLLLTGHPLQELESDPVIYYDDLEHKRRGWPSVGTSLSLRVAQVLDPDHYSESFLRKKIKDAQKDQKHIAEILPDLPHVDLSDEGVIHIQCKDSQLADRLHKALSEYSATLKTSGNEVSIPSEEIVNFLQHALKEEVDLSQWLDGIAERDVKDGNGISRYIALKEKFFPDPTEASKSLDFIRSFLNITLGQTIPWVPVLKDGKEYLAAHVSDKRLKSVIKNWPGTIAEDDHFYVEKSALMKSLKPLNSLNINFSSRTADEVMAAAVFLLDGIRSGHTQAPASVAIRAGMGHTLFVVADKKGVIKTYVEDGEWGGFGEISGGALPTRGAAAVAAASKDLPKTFAHLKIPREDQFVVRSARGASFDIANVEQDPGDITRSYRFLGTEYLKEVNQFSALLNQFHKSGDTKDGTVWFPIADASSKMDTQDLDVAAATTIQKMRSNRLDEKGKDKLVSVLEKIFLPGEIKVSYCKTRDDYYVSIDAELLRQYQASPKLFQLERELLKNPNAEFEVVGPVTHGHYGSLLLQKGPNDTVVTTRVPNELLHWPKAAVKQWISQRSSSHEQLKTKVIELKGQLDLDSRVGPLLGALKQQKIPIGIIPVQGDATHSQRFYVLMSDGSLESQSHFSTQYQHSSHAATTKLTSLDKIYTESEIAPLNLPTVDPYHFSNSHDLEQFLKVKVNELHSSGTPAPGALAPSSGSAYLTTVQEQAFSIKDSDTLFAPLLNGKMTSHHIELPNKEKVGLRKHAIFSKIKHNIGKNDGNQDIQFGKYSSTLNLDHALSEKVGKPTQQIGLVDRYYDYEDKPGATNYWVNFGDSKYCYGWMQDHLHVQDEIMQEEFPGLSYVRQKLLEGSSPQSQVKLDPDEAILVKGVKRLSKIDSKGIYGDNQLAHWEPADLQDKVLKAPAMTTHNILYMDALRIHSPSDGMLEQNYKKALAGFEAARKGATGPVVVNTGAWGSGVFGNSLEQMIVAQYLAAQQAGVQLRYFFSKEKKNNERSDFDTAQVVIKWLHRPENENRTRGEIFNVVKAMGKNAYNLMK